MNKIKCIVLIIFVSISIKTKARDPKVVTDTRSNPYNSICSQVVTRKKMCKNYTDLSTSFFITRNFLLTSGHNLKNNGFTIPIKVVIRPGYYSENCPFDSIVLDKEQIKQLAKVNHKYKLLLNATRSAPVDFALIYIPDSVMNKFMKRDRPSYSFNCENAAQLVVGDSIHVAGYPADPDLGYDGSKMFEDVSVCSQVNDLTFTHDLQTATGNSGSPIYVMKNNKFYVVGLNSRSTNGTYFGTKNFELIQDWMKELKK